MRIYEELFIVRPDATDEQVDPVIEQLRNVITQSGGTIDKAEKWGVRKLAYRVMKQTEGQYILLQFTANADIVKEIERRLRVSDVVMKFITVRIDEKMKFFEKRRKAREARAARKPPAPAPAPAMAAAPAHPGEPSTPVPGAPVTPAAPAPASPAESSARPGGEQPTEGTI
ncbi:MAG TPA: 30S ribosomal protein S6 [Bryobacteraceae bacterium]